MRVSLSRALPVLAIPFVIITQLVACKSNTQNSKTTTASSAVATHAGNRNAPPVNTETPASKPAPIDSNSSAELHTPADGSPERKAILDAVGAELKRKDNFDDAVFDDVESLKVHHGWAYIVADVDDTEGAPYGLVEALLREEGGRWKVSEVFDPPGGGVKEERDARTKFRARYPDAPEDIFPPLP